MSAGVRKSAPWLAGIALLAAWPFVFGTAYDLRVFTIAGIYAILTLGYQFIFGHAGALALTQGTFFGLGAYITALLAINFGWGFAATLPLVGRSARSRSRSSWRRRCCAWNRITLRLATLGIGQVMLVSAVSWESLTGGANGLPGVPGVVLLGHALPRGLPLAAFVWGIAALAALVAWRLTGGLLGRAFVVMRENPIAAMSIGLNIWRLRLMAFLLSAVYAGIAGALYVHTVRVVSPEALEFNIMVAVLTMAVVGGRTRVAGAILGALLLVHLPEWFRFLGKYYLVAYGAMLLAMIIVAPYGLVGAAERLRARLAPAAGAAAAPRASPACPGPR